jgi:acyl carrier protein
MSEKHDFTEFLRDLEGALDMAEGGLTEASELPDEKWDSLAVISAIAIIDDHFQISITGREIKNAKGIQELLTIIKSRLGTD